MQILQWLFKAAHQEPSKDPCDQEVKKQDIVLFKNRTRPDNEKKTGSRNRDFKPFWILCRKDVAKACFYSTINLKRYTTFDGSDIMKKEDIIARGLGIVSHGKSADSGSHVGNKVLPISEATSSSSSAGELPSSSLSEKVKRDKVKAMSRMKEILRWAAATRAEKGGKFLGRKVLLFRNRMALKAVPDDDQLSMDSPKISLRWDVESCSTTTSAVSFASSSRIDQMLSSESATRKGSWITTDSEFVVLEL